MYRAQNAIWLWLGVAASLTLVGYLLDPATAEQSAAGRALTGSVELAYNLMLGAGGIVITYGIWRVRPRAEIIGHMFLGVCVFVAGIAIVLTVGTVLSGMILLGVTAANASRIYYLWSIAPRKADDEPN